MSKRVYLNGEWTLEYYKNTKKKSIKATVPGNVELDLMKAGVLPELAKGNNAYLLRDYEECRWIYKRSFKSPDYKNGSLELVFEGLDCFAEILINGKAVGKSANMLIQRRFNIAGFLKKTGENTIEVKISPAVTEGRKHLPGASEYAFDINWESLSVRKAPHMYGWDIMPRIVSAGIWRDIYIENLAEEHLEQTYLGTNSVNLKEKTAEVYAFWTFKCSEKWTDGRKVRIEFFRNAKLKNSFEFKSFNNAGQSRLNLTDVDFWWPRGAGEANLYDVKFSLIEKDGSVIDTKEFKFGIRTVKLVKTDITSAEEAGEFVFVVNGEKIFVKGTNWVPLDAMHSKDKSRLDAAFEMIKDLNCNMIRCWGGNVYEDHEFFDLCDKNGVMVWQDFALACAVYPQTENFLKVIKEEAESVIIKLRNHSSLVLWSGNNEIDDAYRWSGLNLDPNIHDKISRVILRDAVLNHDITRDYLPSSPYRSERLINDGRPEHQIRPEDHLWGPRDDFKGPFYSSSNCHFVSEIGYHGCPDVESMKEMMNPESLWPWQGNEEWLTHAVRPLQEATGYNYRIKLMADQIGVIFKGSPDNLEDFVTASQISQAEALKYFIEKFRMGKFRKTGILWWNLIDGWPEISDAIVDYYYRRKIAYDYIKRIQKDVCVMCQEPIDGFHEVIAVNDTLKPVKGTMKISDADTGKELFKKSFKIESNGKISAGKVPVAKKQAFYIIEWEIDGKKHMNHYLAGPRPFDLKQYKKWMKKLSV